jgi:hypothetical protein
MCRLSWNLRTSTSWKSQSLSRPVQGLLYTNLHICIRGRARVCVCVPARVSFRSQALTSTNISAFYTQYNGSKLKSSCLCLIKIVYRFLCILEFVITIKHSNPNITFCLLRKQSLHLFQRPMILGSTRLTISVCIHCIIHKVFVMFLG